MFTSTLFLAALLSTTPSIPTQESFDFVSIEGNQITIEFDDRDGTPLADFIGFARTVVDVPLDYDERDVQGILLTISGHKTVRKDDFWHYFQAVLRSRDFLLVPYGNVLAPGRPASGPDTGFFAIRRSSGGVGGGAKPGYIKSQAPVVSPEELKNFRHDAGIVLTTSFVLKHVNCGEAANMLQTYFTDPMLESVRVVSDSNSLVATGFAPTLNGIHALLQLIDVEPARHVQELKRIVLRNAVAEEIRPIVLSMLAGEATLARPHQGKPAGRMPAPNEQEPMPVVESDQRTNSLLVMATQRMHDRISLLVEQLDLEVISTSDTIVLPLKNAVAAELAGTLNVWARSTYAQGISVVADAASNAVLITASEKQLPRLLKLVKKLDVQKRKVEARTVENG